MAVTVSEELIELLQYMENTKGKGSHYHSPKIQDMQARIEEIKSSEEMGVKYMQLWEEVELARLENLAEGQHLEQQRYSSLVLKLSQSGRLTELVTAAENPMMLADLYKEFEL